MALTVTIAGADKTSLVQRVPGARAPLEIDNELKARSTAKFELVSKDGSYRPVMGSAVTIIDSGTTIFGGTIESFVEYNFLGTNALQYIVHCVDYNQIADRRLVARVYENQTAGAIMSDIVSQDLSGEGLTTANVENGPTIFKAIFNYDSAARAFDYLAELTGYAWWIDYSKNLYFKQRDQIAAPFSLTNTSGNFRNLRVEKTRKKYRNRQWLKAGVDQTDTITGESPTPAPDGISRTFVLKYPVATTPTVSVDGSTTGQTVGVLSVDTGRAWYWLKGAITLIQDTSQTVLSTTQALAVTYKGFFPIALRLDLEAEQTARAAVEGGTGIYEAVREVDTDDASAAEEEAQGLLRKYGVIPEQLRFETDTAGLVAGQLIPVNITKHNLNGSWLVDRVRIKDFGKSSGFRYEVLALSGEAWSGWENYFKALVRKTTRLTIQENESIVRVQAAADGVTLADTLVNSSGAAPENRVGFATVGFSAAG